MVWNADDNSTEVAANPSRLLLVLAGVQSSVCSSHSNAMASASFNSTPRVYNQSGQTLRNFAYSITEPSDDYEPFAGLSFGAFRKIARFTLLLERVRLIIVFGGICCGKQKQGLSVAV